MLPGLLCDDRLWQHQVTALANVADCWIPDLATHDSVAGMARDVLDQMPARFALAGLSMGGYVALEIMRQAPERVIALALLDTRADPDTEAETARRRGLIELAEKGRFRGVTERLLPLLIHPSRLDDDALTAAIFAMADKVGRSGFLLQQKAIMGRSDSRPTLSKIACPTLVLCGREDALTPVDKHTAIAAGIRDAKLQVIETCGHLATMERPDEVNEALGGWLSDLP